MSCHRIVWVFPILFLLLLPHARANDCEAVLNLTGRESSLVVSDELRSLWVKESQYREEAADAGVAIEGIPLEAGFSGVEGFDREELSFWRKRYFRALDKVYGPAVTAWLDCIQSTTVSYVPAEANRKRAVVQFFAGRGDDNPMLRSITFPRAIRCRTTDGPVRSGERIDRVLNSQPFIVTCNRRAAKNIPCGSKQDCKKKRRRAYPIDFDTTANFFTTRIQRIIPYSAYNPNKSKTLASLGGCNNLQTFTSKPYDREIQVDGFFVRGNGFFTIGYVAINGKRVIESSSNRPPGQGEYNTPAQSSSIRILAGIPIAIQNVGGSNGGGCLGTGGEVKFTPLN